MLLVRRRETSRTPAALRRVIQIACGVGYGSHYFDRRIEGRGLVNNRAFFIDFASDCAIVRKVAQGNPR